MIAGSFHIKRLIIIIVISVLCYIFVGWLFDWKGSQIVYNQAKNEAMRLARIAAGDIDGDEFEAIDSEESPGFSDVYDKLSNYKSNKSLQFIYSMKKLAGEELVFVVDTDEEDPAEFLEPYEWLPSMAPAFEGEVCADYEITSDEWGTYLSGYAPIFDSQKIVKGIVGCDISLDTINERLLSLKFLVTILAVIPNAIIVMIFGSDNTKEP